MSGLEIGIPSNSKGIGAVILSPQDPKLIPGVQVEPFSIWADDRGYFLEAARSGQGLNEAFPADSTQISCAHNYPGTIKAFHFHRMQTDLWIPAQGMLQVALVDLRRNSPSFGARNTLYVGALRPWRILIPPGVGHGYKVIGQSPSLLVYLTDRFYNPEDEGRIPYNEPGIHYDWELQHK